MGKVTKGGKAKLGLCLGFFFVFGHIGIVVDVLVPKKREERKNGLLLVWKKKRR